MKITVKQLALSLYEVVDGKTSVQVKAVIEKFVEFLAGKNMLAKADKIAAQFVKIWNEKHGIIKAEVATANSLDKASLKLLEDYITKLSGAKEILISEKIDKNIFGGIIIKYGDRVVDGSLRTTLEELKNKMIK